jgi:energy-coupling factor transporter transmembrane protein EcfT
VCACFVAFYVLGTTPLTQASHLLTDAPSTITFFSIGFLLFFATPLIALIYLGLKVLLGQRSRMRWLKSVLVIAWLTGLAFLITSGYRIGVNFREQGASTQTGALSQPAGGKLYVELADSTGKKISADDYEDNNYNVNLIENGRIMINGTDLSDMDRIPAGKPSLQLMPSENDSFYLEETIGSQGRNRGDAVKNAQSVIYAFSQADSVLKLQPEFYISKSGKYRCQNMKLRLAIPAGKQVRFADNIDMWHATVKGDSYYDDTYFNNTTWTVENGKVKCIAGENHENANGDEDAKSRDEDTRQHDEDVKSSNERKAPPAAPAPPATPMQKEHKQHHKDSDEDDDKGNEDF